jgi:hypothetical protein
MVDHLGEIGERGCGHGGSVVKFGMGSTYAAKQSSKA